MINKLISVLVFISLLLLFSVLVYAAGSSTIPEPTPTPAPIISDEPDKKMDCESIQIRKERIKCRLQNKVEEEGNIEYDIRVPEACKTLRNPTACIALYKNVQTRGCYDMEGRDKDKCFKDTIRIDEGFGELTPQERVGKAREYLVLLLYGLEERIENANDAGAISDDNAAEIIELITQIKEDILDGKKRAEILPKLNDLKTKWRLSLDNRK